MAEQGQLTISSDLETKRRSAVFDFFSRLFKEKPLGTVGAIIVLLLLFVGIFADVLAPYGMNATNVTARLVAPNAQHILGTDNLGRDLLSRIIFGARVSMIVGVGAAALSVITGSILGLISGFFGGKTDLVIQRFVDGWMAFPGLILYLSIMALVGQGMTQIIVVLGISGGIRDSRIVRGAVIGIKENIYIEASRAVGASPARLMVRHFLPNVTAPILILFTVACGGMILAEASLSFLGFGIPPPTPSWGGMLSGPGRQYMTMAPWMVLWPGLALALVVYGMNMFGDAVRDLLDPRLRGGIGRYGGTKTRKARTQAAR